MKVVSTNIARPVKIKWKNKEIITGIFKNPTSSPIFLGKDDVKDDNVIDRKYHGGADKACYLFSADKYGYWKQLYPDLNWNWGMFGENITIEGFDETQINIGDVLKIGDAVVQISQPREPCYKLGIKFNTQKVLKDFISLALPGAYVRVLIEGNVSIGNEVIVLERGTSNLTLQKVFNYLYKDTASHTLISAIENKYLAESFKKDLSRKVVNLLSK
ncbi:MOSC domain-containing protein [Abyssalbus ytuae]|uniref:MOSC domain-containing protein n=1 Tax=Abyssalbus ytuae TaxID=2926907 RepID=A0A9E6ZUF1_9FLAO|nr:MOSC domain-containing protein [Abyssalbus ytuae]UOB16936.1 MOSC domain-containing protein [Abyssalbus ytuae]